MATPARTSSTALEFAVAAAPDEVAELFLARDDVESLPGGHGRDPGYELRRVAGGFTLTSDPGAWRPGTRALCEAHVVAHDQGAQVSVRFRVHPLTFTAFVYIAALSLLMVAFQLVVAGPVIAATMLVPFLIIVGLLAADRSNLVRQQRALRTLVESTLTPITLPQLRAIEAPFRRGDGRAP